MLRQMAISSSRAWMTWSLPRLRRRCEQLAGNIVTPIAYRQPRAIYEKLDYSIDDIEAAAGASIALSSEKVKVLMGRMRYPSLSVHGIEGAFYGTGGKTVIPAKVTGKFSIRFAHLYANLFYDRLTRVAGSFLLKRQRRSTLLWRFTSRLSSRS